MARKRIIIVAILLAISKSVLPQGGDFIWAKRIGEPSTYSGRLIASDSNGNIIISGGFQGIADFDPGPATFTLNAAMGNVFLLKLDINGNFLWAKNFGSAVANNCDIDISNNIYITGSFQNTCDFDPDITTYTIAATGGTNGFLMKLNSNGSLVWSKTFGGTSNNFMTNLTLDQSLNVYVTDYFDGIIDCDPGPGTSTISSLGGTDALISKLDPAGNLIWMKRIGGSVSDGISFIKQDISGDIFAVGNFGSTVDFDPGPGTTTLTANGSQDIFILKITGNGNYSWVKSIGSIFNQGSSGLALDQNNNLLISGTFNGTLDVDPGPSIYTLSTIGTGEPFILKLNNLGNFISALNFQVISGPGGASNNGLILDIFGNIFTCGTFQGSVDFDPSPSINSITSLGEQDVYIAKLNNLGDLLWVKSVGSSTIDFCHDIGLDQNEDIYITGQYKGIIDLDPGIGSYTLFTADQNAIWGSYLLKLGNGTVGLAEKNSFAQNNLPYPNPVQNRIFINGLDTNSKSVLILLNNLGQVIVSEFSNINAGLDISFLPSGLYFLKIMNEFSQKTYKIFKE